jgi:hypothetical protein
LLVGTGIREPDILLPLMLFKSFVEDRDAVGFGRTFVAEAWVGILAPPVGYSLNVKVKDSFSGRIRCARYKRRG